MKIKKDGENYLVILEKGENINKSLEDFAKKYNIESGFFSGIGAIENPTLSFYNAHKKEYINKEFYDKFELISCNGNFAQKDDRIFAHIHVVLSNAEMQTIGGHLNQGIVTATAEFYVITNGQTWKRLYNDKIGLFLINPED